MSKYMHTICGSPAYFDGEMLCYVGRGMRLDEILRSSLKEIRREQNLSADYRLRHSMIVPTLETSYIRFQLRNE